MNEEWRQIPSWPQYEASSLGRLRRRSKILSQRYDDGGYKIVTLHAHGCRAKCRVNILVCEAFHGPKPSWADVAAHDNGIKTANRSANLRWTTHATNSADMVDHGTRYQGEDHWAASFTEAQVRIIRAQYTAVPTAETLKRLTDSFDVPAQTIRNIIEKRTWKHVQQDRAA